MTEHGLAHTLSEMPPLSPVINGDPMQLIILVQVNPGETLTIKSDDGNIQKIQGPADVPLMSPNGTLPPIYLPSGFMSQAPQLVYPLPQVEFPLPYIQGTLPQLLPPLPLLLPPPPATFIYQEHHEIYSHEGSNYNQPNERTAKIGEHVKKKLRERQTDGHKNSYMVNNTSWLVNKSNDFSSISVSPSAYTVDNTTSTYAVDYTPSTYTVDNTLSTYTVANTRSTYAWTTLWALTLWPTLQVPTLWSTL
nr:fibronectin type III domain containing protein 3C1-like [Dasypus novemcinctus]